jgi:lysozyme family protein
MTGDFDRAFSIVVGVEGGYVNDQNDPGGETKWGISKKAYPNLDIANLTEDDAMAIYMRDYWNRMRCDEIPWPLSLYVFDSAVNQGPISATRLLQSAVGVQVDGELGPLTMHKAAQATPEQTANFMTLRVFDYMKLNTWPNYGRGWMNRLFKVASAA